MKEFKNKVAVITGAASGIGYGIAKRCAQEGMRIVLADIEEKALNKAEKKMKAAGATILAIPTDVSKIRDVELMAQRTLDTFEAVHLLCNNAGVGGVINSIWESTLADWKWIIGVNLWSVIYGIRVFVPLMLAQNTECHIVNTASMAGLGAYFPSASYQVVKHGVVALPENLYYSLASRESKIKTSVLCPGWVRTRIRDSERNRPVELQNEISSELVNPEVEAVLDELNQALKTAMSPGKVAEHVFNAIREEKFYILTHPEFTPVIQTRMEDMLQGRNPTIPPPSPEQES